MPAVRPRFHLAPCSKFRSHLTYRLAVLLHIGVGCVFPFHILVEKRATVCKRRKRPAEAFQRLAPENAISRCESHLDEVLVKRLERRQEFFLTHAILQLKHTVEYCAALHCCLPAIIRLRGAVSSLHTPTASVSSRA